MKRKLLHAVLVASMAVALSGCGNTMKADRPKELLRNSILTPSLAASILNAKYVNGLPLYRISQEFLRNDIHISRQVMANWVIQCANRYLGPLYDYLHNRMYRFHVLQADETPVKVSKDGVERSYGKGW